FEQDQWFAKIDLTPSDRDHLALTFQDRQENQYGFGGATARSHGSVTDNYDRRWSLRWDRSGDRWFNEVLATSEDS
ncbi:hypothetical protein, partial [Bacillus sp. SIMBA_005]|uniref:hypothetical protein n=1 Tax=Bacillus sp. SIMBA_005 TaxID=3085754 RepID=UPI00397D6714